MPITKHQLREGLAASIEKLRNFPVQENLSGDSDATRQLHTTFASAREALWHCLADDLDKLTISEFLNKISTIAQQAREKFRDIPIGENNEADLSLLLQYLNEINPVAIIINQFQDQYKAEQQLSHYCKKLVTDSIQQLAPLLNEIHQFCVDNHIRSDWFDETNTLITQIKEEKELPTQEQYQQFDTAFKKILTLLTGSRLAEAEPFLKKLTELRNAFMSSQDSEAEEKETIETKPADFSVVLEQLSLFIAKDETKAFAETAIHLIQQFESAHTIELANQLTTYLTVMMERKEVSKLEIETEKFGKLTLDAVFYEAAIALAKAMPHNTTDLLDPSNSHRISEENVVTTSERFLFDIRTLVSWINTKGFVTAYRKTFLHKDIEAIQKIAASKNLTITAPVSGAAELTELDLHAALQSSGLDELRRGLAENPARTLELLIQEQKEIAATIASLSEQQRQQRLANNPTQRREQEERRLEAQGFDILQVAIVMDLTYSRNHNHSDADLHTIPTMNTQRREIFTYLVNEQRLSIPAALTETNELHDDDVAVLKQFYVKGLRRQHLLHLRTHSTSRTHQELVSLFSDLNASQIKVLVALDKDDATRVSKWDLLRDRAHPFTEDHADALIYLIAQQKLPKDYALNVTNQLTSNDARLLIDSYIKVTFYLAQEDISFTPLLSGLNIHQLTCVSRSINPSLRWLEFVKSNFNENFTEQQSITLSNFLAYFDVSGIPVTSLNASQLDFLQVLSDAGLSFREALSEMDGLNEAEIKTLTALHDQGLRKKHLKYFHFEGGFNDTHFEILKNQKEMLSELERLDQADSKKALALLSLGGKIIHLKYYDSKEPHNAFDRKLKELIESPCEPPDRHWVNRIRTLAIQTYGLNQYQAEAVFCQFDAGLNGIELRNLRNPEKFDAHCKGAFVATKPYKLRDVWNKYKTEFKELNPFELIALLQLPEPYAIRDRYTKKSPQNDKQVDDFLSEMKNANENEARALCVLPSVSLATIRTISFHAEISRPCATALSSDINYFLPKIANLNQIEVYTFCLYPGDLPYIKKLKIPIGVTYDFITNYDPPGEDKRIAKFEKLTELTSEEIRALMALYEKGLTIEDLLRLNNANKKYNPNWIFTARHTNLLIYLMKERNHSVVQAIFEICTLNDEQALTLRALYDYGIRSVHLSDSSLPPKLPPNFKFTAGHRELYIFLIRDLGKNIDEAKEIFLKMTNEQILQTTLAQCKPQCHLTTITEDIEEEVKVETTICADYQVSLEEKTPAATLQTPHRTKSVDFLDLSEEEQQQELSDLNEEQQWAVKILYADGLRRAHLLELPANVTFGHVHRDALIFFIGCQKRPVADVIREWKTLSPLQIIALFNADIYPAKEEKAHTSTLYGPTTLSIFPTSNSNELEHKQTHSSALPITTSLLHH